MWQNIEILNLSNYLVSGPNYYPTNFFTENILAIEMKNTDG